MRTLPPALPIRSAMFKPLSDDPAAALRATCERSVGDARKGLGVRVSPILEAAGDAFGPRIAAFLAVALKLADARTARQLTWR